MAQHGNIFLDRPAPGTRKIFYTGVFRGGFAPKKTPATLRRGVQTEITSA
jgi:hypothetical protein